MQVPKSEESEAALSAEPVLRNSGKETGGAEGGLQ